MTRAARCGWVALLAACTGGGGPSTGTLPVGGRFVGRPAIRHVTLLEGAAVWWDCPRTASDATSPSVLTVAAQVRVRAFYDAAPGATASLSDVCGGTVGEAAYGVAGNEAYAEFAWSAPASPGACVLTPRITVPGPQPGSLEDAFPIVVRVGTPALSRLAGSARLTDASGVVRIAAEVAGRTGDLAYSQASATFSGQIASVPAGPQILTATAYDLGGFAIGTGSATANVVAGETTPVSLEVYDTTGTPAVPDHGPVVVALTVPSPTVALGVSQAVTASAMDADGDAITFDWSASPSGCGTFSGSTSAASVQWTAAAMGTCTVTVTATSQGRSDTRSVDVFVSPPSSLAVSPNPASVAVGATQEFTVSPAVAVSWSVTAVPGTPPAPAPYSYPLKFSADGRYLVDQNGTPWRVQADAAWGMSSNGTSSTVDAYLADRRAKGFNSFYFMAMVRDGAYLSIPNAPNDAQGHHPFATANDFTTAGDDASSTAYWTWIDTIIAKAAAQNMVVMLAYNYLGYNGGSQGWASVVQGMTSDQATTWGTWIGNRYRNSPNVIWFHCGDYRPPPGSTLEQRVVDIINAIRATGASQPAMAEMNSPADIPTLASSAIAAADPLMMNGFYGYGPTGYYEDYVTADLAYKASPIRPAWVQEGCYEYGDNTGHAPADTGYGTRRTRLWQALAGGTAGDGYGNENVWPFNDIDRPESLSSVGATYSQYAFAMFATLPWWNLRPSGTETGFAGTTLITSGAGSWGSLDAVTSAVTSDKQYLLAYIPGTSGGSSPTAITVDLTAMAGDTRARWWNPATGAYTDITGGAYTLPNTGTQSFTTPGSNGNANDWVLVLDAPSPFPCGVISSSGSSSALYTAPSTVPYATGCYVKATLPSDPTISASAAVQLH